MGHYWFQEKISGFEALVVAAQFAQSLLLLRTIATYCALSGTTAAQNQLLISLVSESESYADISFVGRGDVITSENSSFFLLASALLRKGLWRNQQRVLNLALVTLGFCKT